MYAINIGSRDTPIIEKVYIYNINHFNIYIYIYISIDVLISNDPISIGAITGIKALRDSKKDTKCIMAVAQDSSRDIGRVL